MVALNIVDALHWSMAEWQKDAKEMLDYEAWKDADLWRISGHQAQANGRDNNGTHS